LIPLCLKLGVKTDPTQYRYSYPWLFRLLAEEGLSAVQLGTFFEIYQLPDEYFLQLRCQAEDLGLRITSVFTAHRELGGFFREEPGCEAVARRSFERLIEVGALLGARSVGSNPGAVYRDRMDAKPRGVERYLRHLRELMELAHERGVPWLTIEPMSCLAEPPTLPEEICQMADALAAYHDRHPDTTARVGFCADIAHGYADSAGTVRHDHLELLAAAVPHLVELHLKNTDARYNSTFGFGPAERALGIIQIEPIRRLLLAQAQSIPVSELVGYLEIGGPKLGRDYSDPDLAEQLRASLRYLKEVWPTDSLAAAPAPAEPSAASAPGARSSCPLDAGSGARASCPPGTLWVAAETAALSVPFWDKSSGRDGEVGRQVRVAPSLMCADLGHLEDSVRQLESAGADLLHLDMADGHFVPNLLLGLDVVRWLRPRTALPLDVHLMVENPDVYVDPLAEIGVELVTVHAEACRHLDRTLARIREKGMRAGAALNPATPLEALQYVLPRLDFVLLMMVNPGFAGGKLVPSGIRKIADCRQWLARHDLDIPIMVDGNVSFEHTAQMVAAGASILVAGTSSWFHAGAPLSENVAKTAEAVAAGLKMKSD